MRTDPHEHCSYWWDGAYMGVGILESLGPIKKIEGHYEGEPSYRFCCAQTKDKHNVY